MISKLYHFHLMQHLVGNDGSKLEVYYEPDPASLVCTNLYFLDTYLPFNCVHPETTDESCATLPIHNNVFTFRINESE
jgi:hypothetical protein